MTVIQIECMSQNGLHARPAALAARLAKEFESQCYIVNEDNNKRADARSVTSIMTLGVKKGTHLRVECSGSDEQDAAKALADLIIKIDK